jgi:hypothetical protein
MSTTRVLFTRVLIITTLGWLEGTSPIIAASLPNGRIARRQGDHRAGAGRDARNAELFFWLYFAMTGLHAIHVTIGIGVLLVLALLVADPNLS